MESHLSFDVGTKNLAYVHVVHEKNSPDPKKIGEVRSWDVREVLSNGRSPICVSTVVRFLDETFYRKAEAESFAPDPEITVVLVEKQPNRNVRMRIMETAIMTFFATKGVPVVLSYSAKHKLGATGRSMRGKKNYSERKRTSCLMAKAYLERVQDLANAEKLEKSKKKDDLADCLLQYLSYRKYKDLDALSTERVCNV
eukprot:1188041-Prorocentrum_minimum.AAC.13